MPGSRTGRGGFTLIELVMVVVITGILAAMALPRMAGASARHRVAAAARRITADLALAQRNAVTTGSSQTVTFDVSADSYTLDGMQHLDHASLQYEVRLASEPYRATLVSVNFDGNEKIVFDLYGAPDNGGSIIVRVGSSEKTILVGADLGKAVVQ